MMASASGQLCQRYSLIEIQSATENFDPGLVVGHGGFGKVYKGHIRSGEGSSTVVAIKRLDRRSDQGASEFRAEIETLSKLLHSHLVSLLGFCDDDREMIVVYEYIPHGSLYDHLHKSKSPLSWMQRLSISIGAARGLDYLHTGAGSTHGVIHRDVKTANVLLDENMAPKISDFGLAKIVPTNQPCTYVNTIVRGTFGYMDPEFFLSGKVTRKTDVFSFGVVLFELLSGRHAVLPDGYEDLSLARWAQSCVKKRKVDKLVAVEIRGQPSPKSLKEFTQIAFRCLDRDPKERPTMSEVVVALQLSLTLQKKYNDYSKPAGLIGFNWMMPHYTVLRTKEKSGKENGEEPICDCRIKASWWISWTSDNPGRRFWCCYKYRDPTKKCMFFRWIDPPLPNEWYKAKFSETHRKLQMSKKKDDGSKDSGYKEEIKLKIKSLQQEVKKNKPVIVMLLVVMFILFALFMIVISVLFLNIPISALLSFVYQ